LKTKKFSQAGDEALRLLQVVVFMAPLDGLDARFKAGEVRVFNPCKERGVKKRNPRCARARRACGH